MARRLLLHILFITSLILIALDIVPFTSVDSGDMRRGQQPTPSSASDSDGSDVESCFDTGDEQEGTDAETKPTNVDTDVDDNKANLPDLK